MANKKSRRQKQSQLIWMISFCAIALVVVIAICLIVLIVKTISINTPGSVTRETTTAATSDYASAENTLPVTDTDPATEPAIIDITDPTTAQVPTTTGSTAPALTGDELLDAANIKAAMYDYDTAIAMLQGSNEYASNAKYQAAVAEYEATKATMVKWTDYASITHIFFHTLIVDTNLSFTNASDTAKYNKVMTTCSEFAEIMQEMYDRGYVVVSLYDIARMETQPDGTQKMVKQPIYLPAGKKPFVLSQDDVSYYEYMTGDGFATKLVIGADGKVTNEYVMPDGSVVYGSYDMIPMLDDFIKLHPDFSYKGAKGAIALTGYNGVFGYRTSHYNYGPENEGRAGSGYLYPNYNIDADTVTATQVANALKADGWYFATHGWGHRAMGQASVENFQADLLRWCEEVIPIIGPCDIVIYPNGDDVGNFWQYTNAEKQNETCATKYNFMKNLGFNYFCNVDSNQYWVQITDDYLRQGRRNVDGQRIYEAVCGYRNLLDDIIDVFKVWDRSRPEPVDGVPVPEGYVIGTYSDRT